MKRFAFICCITLGLSPLFAEAQTLIKEMDGDLKPLKKFNFEILHPYTSDRERLCSRDL